MVRISEKFSRQGVKCSLDQAASNSRQRSRYMLKKRGMEGPSPGKLATYSHNRSKSHDTYEKGAIYRVILGPYRGNGKEMETITF